MRKLLIAGAFERKQRHLITSLRALGLDVSTAHTSAQVWKTLMRQDINWLVLDASASSDEFEPWTLIGDLSELDHPRLIVLTGANCGQDRSRALQSGVCYCLTLPVSPADLCALFLAVEREDHKPRGGGGIVGHYADGALQIDFTNREIRRNGKTFPLTGREFSLMQRLIGNAGRVSTSEELCKCTWGRRAWPAKRTQLKIQILQLRRKIEDDYRFPRYLVSRRGLGYAFMPQAAE